MAELEKVKSFESGVTLIEVMISLVIFSLMLGMTSNLVRKGMEYPFVMSGVEQWVQLIEETGRLIQFSDYNSEIEITGENDARLMTLKKPRDFKSLKLEWKATNLPHVRTAVFTAESLSKRTYQWKVYRYANE
jgi:prepilin-type N-terminal cleavage/methylation domain-containing protein